MSADKTADRPTGVYRMYDATGRLLYIGQSCLMSFRMRTHERHSWWFSLVADLTIEMHPTRESAMAAEAVAIQEEQPPFNVQHTGRKETDWTHLDEADLAVARGWLEADRRHRFKMPQYLWYHLDGIPLRPFAHLEHRSAA